MVSLVKCFTSIFQKRQEPSEVDPNSAIGGLLSNYPANPTQHPEFKKISEKLHNVIAFVNPKSGGQKGRVVYEKLKNYLKKDQIFDLTKGGPKPGLEAHKDVQNLKIIACGGDGTVGWVLSVLDEMQLKNTPSVAILPLGTGNDLARTLNWGGGYNNELMEDFLIKVINGNVVKLDRWNITASVIEGANSKNNKAIKQKAKKKLPLSVMNNYFSIGADAKIALDFHSAREKDPAAFSSQAINKFKYAETYGKDLFQQSCKNLKDDIEIFECDGEDMLQKIKDNNCHSILFLNIPSYAGGSNPWKNEQNSKQSFSDSKLEVVGFHTLDFMFLQMGRHGDKITQASKIRLKTKQQIPMQVDGEPVLLEPAEIIITLKSQSYMIEASSEDSTSITLQSFEISLRLYDLIQMLKLLKILDKNFLKSVKLNQFRLINDITSKNSTSQSQNVELEKKIPDEEDGKKNEKSEEEKKQEKERKRHEKFFRGEERNINLINFHDEFFEKSVLKKDAKTFINAIESFNKTNKNRQLYIDFIYGAVPRMKEYKANKNIDAYKKLLELFPVGPLVMQNKWQRDMMHYPRHQNCVIYMLENMEQNNLCPDTEMQQKVIEIFGDWTHAVKKVKRMMYWMPKFQYANRYANPFLPDLTDQLDLSIAAIERITSVDVETKIHVNLTKEIENDQEDTWIVWAQSTKQKTLLKSHKRTEPVYIEGPFLVWIQKKPIEYFILKSDEHIEIDDFTRDDDNFEKLENIFTKYLDKNKKDENIKVKNEKTVHEQNDGRIYAICCTGTGTKNSIITWTNILQKSNEVLKELAIVYRVKDKGDEIINKA